MALDSYDIARFWSRVEVRKRNQCWPWRYGPNDQGYGEFRTDDDHTEAHRIAFAIVNGAIPDGAIIRHSCDNPLCCNPSHLKAGTHQDNVADRVARDRSARGEENGRAKLVTPEVLHIRQSKLSAKYLAGHYGVHEDTIRSIRAGETWMHLVQPEQPGRRLAKRATGQQPDGEPC